MYAFLSETKTVWLRKSTREKKVNTYSQRQIKEARGRKKIEVGSTRRRDRDRSTDIDRDGGAKRERERERERERLRARN